MTQLEGLPEMAAPPFLLKTKIRKEYQDEYNN